MSTKKVSIVAIANEMKVSPKRARAVLRAASYVRPGTRWVFDADEKQKIKELIRNSRKRAAFTAPVGKRRPAAEQSEGIAAHS